MRILSVNPGHDGTAVLVEDGHLVFSLAAEKDSFPRHSELGWAATFEALRFTSGVPDVVAIGGWYGQAAGTDVGYFGLEPPRLRESMLLGHSVLVASSSHERSHLFAAAAMAPAAPLDECVILTWEGQLGAFYHWQRGGRVIDRIDVLREPGTRYSALYALADPSFAASELAPRLDSAGKLMALGAFADGPPLASDRAVVDQLLQADTLLPFRKADFAATELHDMGVDTPRVHRSAAYLSERLFDIFHAAARDRVAHGLPLLISGGCGLNCEWNRRWADCGLFSSVFVPPCADDSGSAIGTAVDAQVALGGECRLEWTVYAGSPFVRDHVRSSIAWDVAPLDCDQVAARLAAGSIVALAEGRCEIGPRALGHRSLLATPLRASSRERLNAIKRRESFRPIAPSCLSEELARWFQPPRDDPYMLFFSDVTSSDLPAVTHADGSARVHSVGPDGPVVLRGLLQASSRATGYGVLCNTSLNYPGLGFINRASDLFRFAEDHGIADVVVEGDWYRRHGR